MGAINYKTSDIITLAVEPLNTWDLAKDQSFMDEAKASIAEYGGSIDEVIENYINDLNEADYYNAKCVVDEYSSDFFRVSAEYGYYEGSQVVIDSDIDNMWFFEDSEEKRQALKDATQLKKLLHYLNGCGFQACFPGWATSFRSVNDTTLLIDEAIRKLKSDIKKCPTAYTLKKRG